MSDLKTNKPEQAREYFEKKTAFSLGPMEVDHYRKEKEELNLIDVRDAEDYEKGHIPGAISLPEDQWSSLKGLSKDKQNIVYCYTQTCHLAAQACVVFASKGFPVMEMDGGFEAYKESGLEVETGKGVKAA